MEFSLVILVDLSLRIYVEVFEFRKRGAPLSSRRVRRKDLHHFILVFNESSVSAKIILVNKYARRKTIE